MLWLLIHFPIKKKKYYLTQAVSASASGISWCESVTWNYSAYLYFISHYSNIIWFVCFSVMFYGSVRKPLSRPWSFKINIRRTQSDSSLLHHWFVLSLGAIGVLWSLSVAFSGFYFCFRYVCSNWLKSVQFCWNLA